MVTNAFEYHAPSTIGQAAELLAQNIDSAKLLAGGHSLVPLMKLRLAQPEIIIDLGKIGALSFINESGGGLSIGAMTTYAQISNSDLVRNRAPVLAEGAGVVADPQVRNMGTIGGSLAHSDPAGDLPAVALALGVNLVTTSTGGGRTLSIDGFFVDLLTTALEPNEILTEIQVPALAPNTGTAYDKFANKASHYAIVGVAASVTLDSNGVCTAARIGITGAGSKATRASQTEAALVGSSLDDAAIEAAAASAGAGIIFNDDIHASAEYRAHLVTVYASRVIKQAVSRAS